MAYVLKKQNNVMEVLCIMKKIFISHSSEDKEIVGELIALIEGMGVKSEQIFCSSFEGMELNWVQIGWMLYGRNLQRRRWSYLC